MKHTPGPWKFDNTNGRIADKDDTAVGYIAGARKERLENGRLIAAAPELLEALEHMRFTTQEGWITPEDKPTDWQLGWEAACEQFKIAKVNDEAMAAIRKAKGE